jgi:uncharacterized repeat protein (TIGR03803 family)
MQFSSLPRLMSTGPLRRAASCLLVMFGFTLAGNAQTETILHNFVILPYGANPTSTVAEDSAGNLFGTASGGGLYANGVVYELSPLQNGGWSQKVLYTFSGLPEDTYLSRLILDSAGNLYGTIPSTNANYCGLVYRLTPSGSGPWSYTTLYSFNCANSTDGGEPLAALAMDRAGNLYGTTYIGGLYSQGTVFELTPSSKSNWTETILYNFGRQPSEGSSPRFEVTLDKAGHLFGTTTTGGYEYCNYDNGLTNGCGTVFELMKSAGAWKLNVVYTFETKGENEYVGPESGLAIDSRGNLYGAIPAALYELQNNGPGQWSYATIATVDTYVSGTPVFDKAGNLFGETSNYGTVNSGSVFELENDGGAWSFVTLFSFPYSDGLGVGGGVIVDANDDLFGVSYRSMNEDYAGTVFELQSSAGIWTENTLYQFPQVDGDHPNGDLVADSAGNLYGVAKDAGENTNCLYLYYCGVAFRLSPQQTGVWQYDILYDFSLLASVTGATGGPAGPTSGLLFDSEGNVYGTTEEGGPYGSWGDGAVFRLTPTESGPWQETTLYEFGGTNNDGILPLGGLVMDSAGNLYGTTSTGGVHSIRCNCYGGTVFELSPQANGTWQEKPLHSFAGGTDGSYPLAGLTWDQSGNLYGTTAQGGGSECAYGCGTVFKMSPNGDGTWTESILHNFVGSDGEGPVARVIFDSEGNLYGTTDLGGAYSSGVVFKLAPNGSSWSETVLYSFKSGSDGAYPLSDLSFDSAGNLYGTTSAGGGSSCGYSGCGSLFKLTPTSSGEWRETILHRFSQKASDGSDPRSGVYIDASGNLFTTTTAGPGTAAWGTVAEIKP